MIRGFLELIVALSDWEMGMRENLGGDIAALGDMGEWA